MLRASTVHVAFSSVQTASLINTDIESVLAAPAEEHRSSYGMACLQVLTVFLPLMVGWFSISLPSGLGLYYFANIVITSGLQIWLRKLGGTHVLTGAAASVIFLQAAMFIISGIGKCLPIL